MHIHVHIHLVWDNGLKSHDLDGQFTILYQRWPLSQIAHGEYLLLHELYGMKSHSVKTTCLWCPDIPMEAIIILYCWPLTQIAWLKFLPNSYYFEMYWMLLDFILFGVIPNSTISFDNTFIYLSIVVILLTLLVIITI